MLKGIDLSQRIEYSSKDDSDPKTIFILKPMTGLQMLETSKFLKGNEMKINGEYIKTLLGGCIDEVKNPDLKEVAGILAFIEGLAPTVLMELVLEVSSVNKLTDDEVKN